MKKAAILFTVLFLIVLSVHSAFAYDDGVVRFDIPEGFNDLGKTLQQGVPSQTWGLVGDGSNLTLTVAENKSRVSFNNLSDAAVSAFVNEFERTVTEGIESAADGFDVAFSKMRGENTVVNGYPGLKVSADVVYTWEDGRTTDAVCENYSFSTNDHIISLALYGFSDEGYAAVKNALQSLEIHEEILQPQTRSAGSYFPVIGACIGALVGGGVGLIIALSKKRKNRRPDGFGGVQ